MKLFTVLGVILLALCCAGPACEAVTVNYNVINNDLQSLGMQCNDYAIEYMSFSVSGVDRTPGGPALVSLSVFGDFDGAGTYESLGVICEGFNFGVFMDGDPNDDIWANVNNDFGNQCSAPSSTTATVPYANLKSIVADGTISCTISIGYGVNCFCGHTDVYLNFAYPDSFPASSSENFESFGCGVPSTPFLIMGGLGTVTSSFPFFFGAGCAPFSLCYANAISRGNRALGFDNMSGEGIVITLETPMDFFSGYFTSCRTDCCTDAVTFTFYRNGASFATYTQAFGATGGALSYYEKYACFDKVVISGNFVAMDDLRIGTAPSVVTCPVGYPKRISETFEGIPCGVAASSVTIFGGFATLTDSVPYIWGTGCSSTWSLCYANGVSNGRTFGHDSTTGSTTITFNSPVYGFGGKFATCQGGGCCTDSILFEYFIGNALVFSESVTFGASAGALRPYFREYPEFTKVKITSTMFIMDDIFYTDGLPKYTPTDTGLCTATISFPNLQSDTCRPITASSTNPSGSVFPIGITWVTNVVDDGVYQSSCTFAVHVRDEQAPILTCPANAIFKTADAGTCSAAGVTYNVPVSDNCGIQSSSVVPSSPSSFPVGSTVVLASAVDIYGNPSQCDFVVIVQDTQAPVITCPANMVVNAPTGECSAIVNFPAATVTENCGQVVLSSTVQSGFDFPIGTTTVTYTATDAAGLFSSCSFTVTVNDLSLVCFCGNGKVNAGEECEVNQLGGATCASKINPGTGLPYYPDGGVLDCTQCKYDYSRCAVCGDGRVDGTEQCDSSNLDQQTCITRGFSAGTLTCSNTCRFVTTGCSTCGNSVREGSELCDRTDLNGKTCTSLLGSAATGTLSCNSDCTFNTQLCIAPKVTAPDGSRIQYITLGISVSATGFTGDRKVIVSMTDGTLTQTFPETSLTMPSGTLTATFRPTILRPSAAWKVFVKGTTTQYQAQSAVFTAKNSP